MPKVIRKIYTGVGSRETPPHILSMFQEIGRKLGEEGWTLRSGGADGADMAFETFAKNKEIYLPWRGFNGSESHLFGLGGEMYVAAEDIAMRIHPNWTMLSYGGKKLHTRNVFQVLGINLDTPSRFLICWTDKGEAKGGTRTSIILARECLIPIFNFGDRRTRDMYDQKGINYFLNVVENQNPCPS